MTKLRKSLRKNTATTLAILFASVMLSACTGGNSEVSGWWYHQEYETAAVTPDAD